MFCIKEIPEGGNAGLNKRFSDSWTERNWKKGGKENLVRVTGGSSHT